MRRAVLFFLSLTALSWGQNDHENRFKENLKNLPGPITIDPSKEKLLEKAEQDYKALLKQYATEKEFRKHYFPQLGDSNMWKETALKISLEEARRPETDWLWAHMSDLEFIHLRNDMLSEAIESKNEKFAFWLWSKLRRRFPKDISYMIHQRTGHEKVLIEALNAKMEKLAIILMNDGAELTFGDSRKGDSPFAIAVKNGQSKAAIYYLNKRFYQSRDYNQQEISKDIINFLQSKNNAQEDLFSQIKKSGDKDALNFLKQQYEENLKFLDDTHNIHVFSKTVNLRKYSDWPSSERSLAQDWLDKKLNSKK